MLDLNHDQASLSQWNATRGELLNPKLMPVPENLTRDVRKFASELDWLFIDTPPVEMDLIEAAVMVSDAVIIPMRCGFFDVMALISWWRWRANVSKPFAFVLNAVDQRSKTILRQTLLGAWRYWSGFQNADFMPSSLCAGARWRQNRAADCARA